LQRLSQKIHKDPFSHQVRVRACGILVENEKILLLKHTNIGPKDHLWSPPGGGVEFGQEVKEVVKREFMEEVNLEVEVDKYLFTNEYIGERHHAIELFFAVKRISGEVLLGADPELSKEKQILTEVSFFDMEEIKNMDKATIHNAFHTINSSDEITDLTGLITFKD